MPDITMCINKYCGIRETCYRHTAKPSNRQSVAHFQPYITADTRIRCEQYYSNKENKDE